MRFNTHNRTPIPPAPNRRKELWVACSLLVLSLLIVAAIVCADYAHSPLPALVILGVPLILATLVVVHIGDMRRAYVEIQGNRILVADYFCSIEWLREFAVQDIARAEILPGSSPAVRSPRYGVPYMVFRDSSGKYLFKLISLPETRSIFQTYLQ